MAAIRIGVALSNPVLVNSWRGDVIENRHRGAIAICDVQGRLLHQWGDVEAPVYPRSAIKLLQALPLVESGAADHFGLSAAELALACSSHSAEAVHIDAIGDWLDRIGLEPTALECGAHAPLDEAAANALLIHGVAVTPIHNNCSGKHTGMLTVSRFLGETTSGYIDRDHPAQQRWFDTLGDLADVDMRRLPWNYAGCGIPVIAMPLKAIATAFARAAAPETLDAGRAQAIEHLTDAIAANPRMIAGSGRLGSEVIAGCGDRILVKSGADGVYTALLRHRGIGIAVKIDDGNGVAAEVAILAALDRIGALTADDRALLQARIRVPICNTRSVITGYRQAAEF